MLQAMYNGVSAILPLKKTSMLSATISRISTQPRTNQEGNFCGSVVADAPGRSADTGTVGGVNANSGRDWSQSRNVSTLESQGGLLSTSAPTNLAIQGNGYFMLSDPSYGVSYTRDGHFSSGQ